MESTQLEKYVVELKAMRDRLVIIEHEFAEDSDYNLYHEVYEFLNEAQEDVNDALKILNEDWDEISKLKTE